MVPGVIGGLVEQIHALSALAVPSMLTTNAPSSSPTASASVARVGAPAAATTQMPFSDPVDWSLSRMRLPVARVTPSSVEPFWTAEASVTLAVDAARTASL